MSAFALDQYVDRSDGAGKQLDFALIQPGHAAKKAVDPQK